MGLLHNKTLDALTSLGSIERQMVEESEGKPGYPAAGTESIKQTENGPEVQYTNLKSPFNISASKDFLLPGCPARKELNSVLEGYMNFTASLTPDKDPGKLRELLDPSIYLPGEGSAQTDLSLLSSLHSIEILKNNILAVESRILTYIASR
jgi:hypothetical protein